MKIRYEFANGDVMEIEVEDEIGMYILQSRRQESSAGRKHRRWNRSLDAVNDKSSWVGSDEHNPEELIERESQEECRMQKSAEIRETVDQLEGRQKELTYAMKNRKFTQEKYAKKKGVTQQAISSQVQTIRKKFKIFL